MDFVECGAYFELKRDVHNESMNLFLTLGLRLLWSCLASRVSCIVKMNAILLTTYRNTLTEWTAFGQWKLDLFRCFTLLLFSALILTMRISWCVFNVHLKVFEWQPRTCSWPSIWICVFTTFQTNFSYRFMWNCRWCSQWFIFMECSRSAFECTQPKV